MKQKPFYKTSIAYDLKDEWMTKEYGSWEDHDCPETRHIYPLLRDMPDTQIICFTKEEAEMVKVSASYQTSWDSDESIIRRLKAKCGNICNQLGPLLK